MKKKIAVIGAGIAGITVAKAVQDIADVIIFEKSRGLGGRMAQRRRTGYAFDHGAQYFSVRSAEFANVVQDSQKAGAVAPWPSTVSSFPASGSAVADPPSRQLRYIGVPSMSSLAAHIATSLDIRRQVEVNAIENDKAGWLLKAVDDNKTESVLGPFDFVICATPAPQAQRLLPADFCGHQVLAAVKMSGCFTLMIGDTNRSPPPFEAVRIDHPVLSWVAANNTKPDRPSKLSLTAHSRNDWAEAYMEADRDWIRQTMIDAVSEVAGMDFSTADWIDLHRWRYANVEIAADTDYLWDEGLNLAACGDWCLGNRVEAAFESGRRLGLALKQRIERN